MTRLGLIADAMSPTAAAPDASAARNRSAWTAGIAAVPGSVIPNASETAAIVLAVPITAHVPAVVARLPSICCDLRRGHLAAAILRPEPAAIGARTEALAAIRRRQHRTGEKLDRRNIGRRRAHQLRGDGLVAAADEHDRIHRLRADHLLDVHRHQVAEHHAGRTEEHFAERDRREVDRQAAGGEHASLHGVDQLRKMSMAVVEAARAVRDADDRPGEHLGRISHRLRERAPQIQREIGIAVVREAPGEAVLGVGQRWSRTSSRCRSESLRYRD